MKLARTLLRIEQVVHALRVTTEAVGTPGVRDRVDAWVGASARRAGGARMDRAARVVAGASDAAPLSCGALAVATSARNSDPLPALYAAVSVGVPLAAPVLVERLGGPVLPLALRRSVLDGAAYGALASLGGGGTAAAAAGAIAAGTARVHLGAGATDVAAGTATGWVWARLNALVFATASRRRHTPPPVEIDDYRDRRSSAP